LLVDFIATKRINMVTTAKGVITIVSVVAGRNEDAISRDSTFDSLGIYSLELVNLALALQEEFTIVISDGDLEGLKTVGQTIDYLDRALLDEPPAA